MSKSICIQAPRIFVEQTIIFSYSCMLIHTSCLFALLYKNKWNSFNYVVGKKNQEEEMQCNFSRIHPLGWLSFMSAVYVCLLLFILHSDNPQMSLLCNCTNCFTYCLLHKQLRSFNKDLLPVIRFGSLTKWIFLVSLISICMKPPPTHTPTPPHTPTSKVYIQQFALQHVASAHCSWCSILPFKRHFCLFSATVAPLTPSHAHLSKRG